MNKNLLKHILLFFLGIILIYFLFKFSGISYEGVITKLKNNGIYIFLTYTIMSILIYYYSAVRWKLILHELMKYKKLVTNYDLFNITSIGCLGAQILPKVASEIGIKSILLKKKYDIDVKTSMLSIFLEHFMNILISGIFVFPSLFYLFKLITMDVVVVLFCIEFFLLFLATVYFNKFIFMRLIWLYFVVGDHVEKFLNFAFKRKIKRQQYLLKDIQFNSHITKKITIHTILRHIANAVGAYVVFILLNIEFSFFNTLVCTSSMAVIGLFSFLPAQLGVCEWGWYALLKLCGLSDSDSVSFLIISRVLSDLPLIILGLISLMLLKFNFKLNSFKKNENIVY